MGICILLISFFVFLKFSKTMVIEKERNGDQILNEETTTNIKEAENIFQEKEEEVKEFKEQKCFDGTLNMQCSKEKPLYCNNLELADNCEICGCPDQMICEKNKCISTILPESDEPINIPVLMLSYFPSDKNDSSKVDLSIVGPYLKSGTMIKDLREKVDKVSQDLLISLEEGSSYHKYKNEDSKPALDYSILESKEFLRPILRTNNADFIFNNNGDWGFTADHFNELKNIDVCDYVNNKGVKEIWIWMYHYAPDLDSNGFADQDVNRYHISPTESNMSSPYGDISNSYRINDLPLCQKTYTVYEYNYTRGLGEAIENHTHQIEAVLGNVNYDVFWNKFVGGENEPLGCGWTHCPPNVMPVCSSHNYDWYNEVKVHSDCANWNINRKGEKEIVDCHTWAGKDCKDDGGTVFKIWWMQNIPNEWWIFISDFDKAMKEGKKLTFPY